MSDPQSQSESESTLQNPSALNTTPPRDLERLNPDDFPDSLQTIKNPLSTDSHSLTKWGEARRRLGLTDLQMRKIPSITPAVREAVGSVKRAIEIIAGDDNPDSLQFMEKWNSISPSDKKVVKLEDVVIASGLTTRRFIELLSGATFEHSASVGRIFTAHSQLRVLKATVHAATEMVPITSSSLDDKGNLITTVVGYEKPDIRAQEIFHKITGALPTPKGAQFTFNQNVQSGKAEIVKSEPVLPLQSMDSLLLEMEEIRKPKMLNAPSAPDIPVEIPANEPEIEYLPIEGE